MTDIRDEVATALIQTGMYVDEMHPGLDTPMNYADALLRDLAARGLTVVCEGDCHCAERNVTHGRGCPCGNLARQPEGQ